MKPTHTAIVFACAKSIYAVGARESTERLSNAAEPTIRFSAG